MVLIIFTRDGLEAFQAEISDDISALWTNPQLLSEMEREQFQSQGINCIELPQMINVENNKSTLWALEYVEKNSQDQEIMIECL
ncbi:hypothetical protein [Methylophaga pinxianii]|uniref:hypothetical protein n=1 Tax=Methylophaga pinxianii TaxID=2881052 RepID=UPI001CF3EEBC|nr:hypothetical protein [Methylophaga pinxianii]MCB2427226.1 hypothetical protein [Methylophaga pinxianii]UPH46719.1 hypothetical protein LGT42_005385 [Methylophaga pinxianii]